MGNGMNKVLPGLYVGNFRDSRDEKQLKDNKITHILSIHDNAKATRSDMVYLCLDAKDSASQDLTKYFSQCNDFIHSARMYGGHVLVHCLAGMSRSVTLTVAYIMSVTTLGWRDALNVVRVSRTCASPNFGFQKQLVAFQHEGVAQERERLSLVERPPDSCCPLAEDGVYCQARLEEHAIADIPEPRERTTESVHCLLSHLDELFPRADGQKRSTLVINLKKRKAGGDEGEREGGGDVAGVSAETVEEGEGGGTRENRAGCSGLTVIAGDKAESGPH